MSRKGTSRVRAGAIAILLGAAALSTATGAEAQTPVPEPNFAADIVPARPCALDSKDVFQKRWYESEGWKAPDYVRYPGACQRLKFSYGPLLLKPGQNDVLVGPVTIEKPVRDGYITRFRPDLVDSNGKVPPVEQVHLHHGTWLTFPDYGNGPFFAAGEEKTIAPFPRGYGMPIKASDTWLLLYMVHSAISKPLVVYITYDIDFIPKDKGDALGLKPAYPIWLDVRPSGYPVFNVQRSFGGKDGKCTWPMQQCAHFDPYGQQFTGQGQPGNGRGQDLQLPAAGQTMGRITNFKGGTLIGIGGHLHPGGLTNDIDLVRPGGATVKVREQVKRRVRAKGRRRAKTVTRTRWVAKHVEAARIYTGRAWYWNRQDSSKPGGPPTSWDFSMEVQGLPRWGVHVKPGDILRSNATYDTTIQASYEDMGISIALLVPDAPDGKPQAPGIDVFDAPWTAANGPWVKGSENCGPAKGNLCDTGTVTHGHYVENGNYSGPEGTWGDSKPGQVTSEVGIADFLYAPGDFSLKPTLGVPQVKLGSTLRFTNLEGLGIYHTVTTCAFPCLGPVGAAFPIADGRSSTGRKVDLDSAELGIGAPYVGAASQRLDWSVPITPAAGFAPGETVTYFCRIHPFMRGAFQVTQ